MSWTHGRQLPSVAAVRSEHASERSASASSRFALERLRACHRNPVPTLRWSDPRAGQRTRPARRSSLCADEQLQKATTALSSANPTDSMLLHSAELHATPRGELRRRPAPSYPAAARHHLPALPWHATRRGAHGAAAAVSQSPSPGPASQGGAQAQAQPPAAASSRSRRRSSSRAKSASARPWPASGLDDADAAALAQLDTVSASSVDVAAAAALRLANTDAMALLGASPQPQAGPTVLVTRPLPRVLIIHTGGTLGMEQVRGGAAL